MYGGDSTFDDYRKKLQNVLQDPSEEPVRLSLDYLKAITDGFSKERLVGRGGFGEVYRGVLGREKFIAVKKLEHVVDDGRYQAELNSLIKIRHPNIVQLIGYCAETKLEAVPQNGEHILAEVRQRFLCFEFISNGSLRDYVQDLDLGWDKRYAIMEGICKGLDFLHEECNLTHMDLKPENILMGDNMVPKITDFGLSRLNDAGKSQIFTLNLTGTLGYMAPEYLNEGKISHKTDIYSLGVIMCEIIAGEKVPIMGWNSNNPRSMEFTERACGRWVKIFEKSLNEASLKEIYIKQVKQLLDIALKCVDRDRTKRPGSSEILKAFYPNPAERSLCESNSNYGQDIELLSVNPLQLNFSLPEPKRLHCSSCSLHLTNNVDVPVVFRLLPSETLSEHFLPQSGVVPPKCRYTLAVVMHHQQNPRFGNDFFTLESTKERYQGLRITDRAELFKRARERGHKVHEVKIAVACAHTDPPISPNSKSELAQGTVSWGRQDVKPQLKIMPLPTRYRGGHGFEEASAICVHPSEPWILRASFHELSEVWDYNRMEKLHFCFAQPQRVFNCYNRDETDIYGDADGQLSLPPGWPMFISRKRWILVGSSTEHDRQNPGYIYVYSYMAVQNFKGSKSYISSNVKSFKAHDDRGIVLLDVHPSRPYVLSSLAHDDAVMSSIKLWNWESGWDCVQTFNVEGTPRRLKFNPNDPDTFATVSQRGDVKVWGIDSPKRKFTCTLPMTNAVTCLDFFTQDGKQYWISVHSGDDSKCMIWDYDTGTLVETLKDKKGISTVCSHPELPVLITGSADGRVSLWSSSTFNLVGVLNCCLGRVISVSGVKGSERIVIQHMHGIAVVEIGHMLESERPQESEESEIGADKDKAG